MKIKDFVSNFNILKPSIDSLMKNGGFSESFSNILLNDFSIVINHNEILDTSESLIDFLNICNVNNLCVGKINFADSLNIIDELNSIVIGGFDGGYLTRRKNEDSFIRIVYTDELENDELIFCETDDEFFRILLLLTEYYSQTIQGESDEISKTSKRIFK
ncbi:MAG: hypothetical protein HC854_02845 [Flavobacterium sp.]|nr:hypothetical protein [Flavobacterium sp.]